MRGLTLVFVCASACTSIDAPDLATVDQAATVCGVGPTVKGIDVSYYQGTIDWAKVKADGVKYAFIRVSDGTGFVDPKFATYWADSRAQGILHGAYQFFEPATDAIAQADLLLTKMGPLEADDLPPVLDVEVSGGLGAAAVAAGVKKWADYVTSKIGIRPIIYTGFYFWRDSVGGADETASPLWHAQYTTAACPDIAAPWTNWAFWQYTSTGAVAGISGGVDVDRFNGDITALAKLEYGAQTTPCAAIDASGGIVDDATTCFEAGGPSAYMRGVTDAGYDSSLTWTHTTNDASEANFGTWNLIFTEAGHYHVEAYTAAAYAQSKKAVYNVHAVTDTDAMIDQSAADGWQPLGDFEFAAGPGQTIHLADNTGEPTTDNVQLVFDAIRFTRLPDGDGSGSGSGSGSGDGGGDDSSTGGEHAGCSAGHGTGWGVALVLALVLRRRRR